MESGCGFPGDAPPWPPWLCRLPWPLHLLSSWLSMASPRGWSPFPHLPGPVSTPAPPSCQACLNMLPTPAPSTPLSSVSQASAPHVPSCYVWHYSYLPGPDHHTRLGTASFCSHLPGRTRLCSSSLGISPARVSPPTQPISGCLCLSHRNWHLSTSPTPLTLLSHAICSCPRGMIIVMKSPQPDLDKGIISKSFTHSTFMEHLLRARASA